MVTPSDALRNLQEANKIEIDKLEAKIDLALSSHDFLSNPDCWINLSNYNSYAVKSTIDRYRSCWTIKYNSDQRDGSAYIFTMPIKGELHGRY